jgi:hypothetical protein
MYKDNTMSSNTYPYFIFHLQMPDNPAPKPSPEWPPTEPAPKPPDTDPVPTVPPVTALHFQFYSSILN